MTPEQLKVLRAQYEAEGQSDEQYADGADHFRIHATQREPGAWPDCPMCVDYVNEDMRRAMGPPPDWYLEKYYSREGL